MEPKRGVRPPRDPPFDLHAPKSIGFFYTIRGYSIPKGKVLSVILSEIIDGNQKRGGLVFWPPHLNHWSHRFRSSVNTTLLGIGISHMKGILIKIFYHGEKAATDGQTDGRTDRRTDRRQR